MHCSIFNPTNKEIQMQEFNDYEEDYINEAYYNAVENAEAIERFIKEVDLNEE